MNRMAHSKAYLLLTSASDARAPVNTALGSDDAPTFLPDSSGAPTAGGTVGEAPSLVGVLAWTPVVAVVLGVAPPSGVASTRRFAGYSFSKARLALSVVRNPRFMAYSNVVCTIVNKSKETK